MSFRVLVNPKTEEKLKALPEANIKKMVELLDVLQENPIPVETFDIKKLKGLKDTYRVRVGRYRVIYTIFWDEKEIAVSKIEPRKSAYKQ